MTYFAYALSLVTGAGLLGSWALVVVLVLLWIGAILRASRQAPGGDFRNMEAEAFVSSDRGITRATLISLVPAALLYLLGLGIALLF